MHGMFMLFDVHFGEQNGKSKSVAVTVSMNSGNLHMSF